MECPTLLENGYGEHNIQGIGDKHVPLIHNVMNTDVVVAVTDRATDHLQVMFNSEDGLGYLADRRLVPQDVLSTLQHFGLSSICNVLAAITTAKLLGLGADDAIITVATDGGSMYPSERAKISARDFGGGFTNLDAAAVWGEHLANVPTAHAIECTEQVRNRIFNLGYYTWVEQQGDTDRGLRRPPRAVVLDRSAALPGRLGRDDHGLQRPGRRSMSAVAAGVLGWRCAVCGTTVDVASRSRSCVRERTRPIGGTCSIPSTERRFQPGSTTSTRSSPTARAWRGGHSPGPTG